MKTRLGALLVVLFVFALGALFATGSHRKNDHIARQPSGSATVRGKKIIIEKHCGSCHVIPGVPAANGLVGPPLLWFARRTFIAGELPNTPENLARWIKSPTAVEPKTAMPNLGLTDAEATDVVAYLYTLQ